MGGGRRAGKRLNGFPKITTVSASALFCQTFVAAVTRELHVRSATGPSCCQFYSYDGRSRSPTNT